MISPYVPLDDLVTISGGGTPSKKKPEYFTGAIPWVSPKDMKSWEITTSIDRITEQAVADSSAKLIEPDAVLLVIRSGVLKHSLPVGINRVPVTVNQDMKALRCGDRLLPEYLARYLQANARNILTKVRGTTADNIPTDSIRQLKIPLPPLSEQKRIAEILDRAEALRSGCRAALALLDELTQSIFLEMFGDPGANPIGWKTQLLSDVISEPLRNGLSPSKSGKVVAKVLTLSAITGSSFDATALKESTFKAKPPDNQSVAEEDLLICRGNGNIHLVGRGFFPARRMADTTFPDTMIAARIDPKKANCAFLNRVWNSQATRRQIESSARTTNGTFKVNQTALGAISFIAPPLKLQEQFADRVVEVEAQKAKLLRAVGGSDSLFASLQQRAFRGEL